MAIKPNDGWPKPTYIEPPAGKLSCARYMRLGRCPPDDLCGLHAIRTSGLFVNLDERPCIIRQAGDHTYCAKPGCGLSWDTNDPEPPVCPTYAVAVQRRNARQVGEAQRRLSALYGEPSRRLWGIWPAGVALAVAGGYLAWQYLPGFVAWLTQSCAC